MHPIESDDDQRLIDAADRVRPTAARKRRCRAMLGDAAVYLSDRLGELLVAVADGTIDRDEATKRAAERMAAVFDGSMHLGYVIAGLPGWEHTTSQRAALRELVDAETAYFAGMVGEAMSSSARIGMYGRAADAAFHMGMVSALPANAKIDWRLGIAEHCQDCLGLAARGPYDKPGRGENALPSLPRDGGTRCLRNCRCHLVVVAGYKTSLVAQIGVEIIAAGAIGIDPGSDAAVSAAAIYQPLAADYAYLRRRAWLEPGTPYLGMAEAVAARINETATAIGHTVRMAITDEEIVEPVARAIAVGLVYMAELRGDEEIVGRQASIVVGDYVYRGTIVTVAADMVTIKGVGPEQRFGLTRGVGALLFVEDEL